MNDESYQQYQEVAIIGAIIGGGVEPTKELGAEEGNIHLLFSFLLDSLAADLFGNTSSSGRSSSSSRRAVSA